MVNKKKTKLSIIHLEKNINLSIECEDFIILGPGSGIIKKGNRIFLTNLQKKFFTKVRSLLTKKLFQQLKKENLDFFLEYEISNIRNDKIKFFDCIMNYLLIQKIINKKKYDKIELITDNKFSTNIFDKMKIKNLVVKNFSDNYQKLPLIYFFSKFIMKFLCVKLLTLFSKKNHYKNEDISFNMFPNFYKNENEIFFKNKNFLKLNFLFTDETHLNHSLYEILKIFFNSKKLDIVNIEQYVTFKDLKNCLIYFLSNYKKLKKSKKKLVINNLNFSNFYEEYLQISFLNRSKLQIYNSALKNFLTQLKPKRFHMYMFEYSFGFYLINQIKKNFKNIEILGYQHGIFSDKLLWLDLLKINNSLKYYSPHKIISLNKSCEIVYKKIYKKNAYKYLINNEFIQSKNFFNFIDYNGKKNIFFPGTHDVNDLIKYLDNINPKEKKNFLIKLHPKTKLKLKNHNLVLIKDLQKVKINKVFLSSTSTMVYNFKKNKKKYKIFKIDYKFDLTNKDYTSNNIIVF